jgi:hypothetical protein
MLACRAQVAQIMTIARRDLATVGYSMRGLVLDVTEALAVLLQIWNRACYLYHNSNTAEDLNHPFEFTPKS